ncbi:MAG: hypothetical protein CMD15_02905 [Flavobacteriales bacterium]|nr:hypothetical protein [Flavobacteriales bacterium]|tara:strand:+ start:87 stop:563 length:477 start_codon:yes stop_codon:yes gene_type:complete
MKNIKEIFNFKKSKTKVDALVLYLCASAGGLLIAFTLGAILGGLYGIGYGGGFIVGLIVSLLITLLLTIKIFNDRKLGIFQKIFLVVGIIISPIFGLIFGVLPLAIIATSQIHNEEATEEAPAFDLNNITDKLMKLQELKEKGILTEEEFTEQKKKLL